VQSIFSPGVAHLRAQGSEIVVSTPLEGCRGWHADLCLSAAASGELLDMAYAYLNWWQNGWAAASAARQGYYATFPDWARSHLDPDEWDYWYDGRPAVRPLADPYGTANLGFAMIDGEGLAEDRERGIEFVRAAAECGNSHAAMWIATLAIAGVPPLAGFFSKDEILAAVFSRAHGSPLADVQLLGINGSVMLYAIYGLGVLTALLTAIYMTRLMLLAFTGENRTGASAAEALHEAPAMMTGPVLVLAGLTIIGGWLNLPAVLPIGPAHLLSDWLEPVTGAAGRTLAGTAHLDHTTELVLIGTAIAIAVLGMGIAFVRYRSPVARKVDAVPEVGVAALVADAYRVDAGLDRLVVRPLGAFSTRVLWQGIDQTLERAFVRGGHTLSRLAGLAHDRLGEGDVGRYAWVIALGAIAILAAFTVR
jgi:hypothetical protein